MNKSKAPHADIECSHVPQRIWLNMILEYTKAFIIAIILLSTCISTFNFSYEWSKTGSWFIIRPHAAFWIYISALSLFHLLEFICTVTFYSRNSLSKAFLLDHSREYHMAVIGAILEYWIEKGFIYHIILVDISEFRFIAITRICLNITKVIGLIALILGQTYRTWTMLYSGQNFTHKIMTRKRTEHVLVTTGPYR